MLVEGFKLGPVILVKFIPKTVEVLLIETTTSLAFELVANSKVLLQTGEERILRMAGWRLEASRKHAFGPGEHLLIAGYVDHLERRQAGEHGPIVLEIGFKTGRLNASPVDVTE